MRPRRRAIAFTAITTLFLGVAPTLRAQTAATATQPASGDAPPIPASPDAPQSQPSGDAAGETVVAADRVATPVSRVGSSVTVITAEEIKRKQLISVADALRQVPGIDVSRAGPIGQQTSVFMRGGNSGHTLVLIDGVEANDPSSPARAFDFAHLTTDNIERIEVIRGPQSLMWGSDAMGGVINIVTKKGDGKPTFSLTAEGGSFGMYREAGAASGGDHLFNYSVGFSRFDNAGVSAADSREGNSERDGYHATNINARLGFTPADEYDVNVTLRHTDAYANVDKDGGSPGPFTGDESDRHLDTSETYFHVAPRVFLLDGVWESQIGVGVNDTYHTDTGGFAKDNAGRNIKVDWLNTFRPIETNTLVVGVETETESYDDSTTLGHEVRNDAAFLNDQMVFFDRLTLGAGVRVDNHETYGVEPTYRFTAAYDLKETRTLLRASYGTGFKAPTLYQLYSAFGSTSLNPERSHGWDAGVEQTLITDKLSFGATYFANDFEDLIDFGPSFTYVNIGEARTSGVETFIATRPIENLGFRLTYTYTDTEAGNDKQLLRRPPHKFSLDADWKPIKPLQFTLGLNYVGQRDDIDPNLGYSRVHNDGYVYLSLAGSYQVHKNVRLFARLENALDERYQEVKGFGAPGIGAFGGVQVTY